MAIRWSLLAAMLVAATPVAAQKPDDVVKWTAKAPAVSVKPGGTLKIQLSAKIEEGWILYALVQPDGGPIALDIAVAKGKPFSIDATRVDAPLPASKTSDSGSENYYESKVELGVPLTATASAKAGKHVVPIDVTYQVCSGSICLRPHTETLPVSVNVTKQP